MSRRRHKESIDINLIPYIDILLVLVLILMLSSTLSYHAHGIDLPSTHGQEIETLTTQQHITLNKEGMVNLVVDEKVITLGSLDTLTIEQMKDLNPQTVYIIDADSQLSYQKIVDLLTLLKVAGVHKVALAMQSQ